MGDSRVTPALITPRSIVVVGGSSDVYKPGGRVLENLRTHAFGGTLSVINPKLDEVQGVRSYRRVEDAPQVDLAILAIAARFCPHAVEVLARDKGTKAFIILSAGFHEENAAGAALEKQIVDTVNRYGACLIGPNCVGVMNPNYVGVFIRPVPKLEPKGIDFVTGSGATAVFILELGMQQGLSFSSVFSVGNSGQLGVEEILEYLDESFEPDKSSRVKLLYVENISNPAKLYKHARSLVAKGCRIAAIKAGTSPAGSRAASSHTGALASSDAAVEALFRKAGIVRCKGRQELLTTAAVFMHKPIRGRRVAIITHAGGPAVMLTDALSDGGLEVPHITGPAADALLSTLFDGSSVGNPIDFLATGTAEQLGNIIDACERDFDVDCMVVIFGSPGLFPVHEAYNVLHEKIRSCSKPIFPVLPSLVNAADAIRAFIDRGNVYFQEEVVLGEALCRVVNAPEPAPLLPDEVEVDVAKIRAVVEAAPNGYLSPTGVQALLDAVGIARAGEKVVSTVHDAVQAAENFGYPIVMKVVGPVHKSDVGGVVLGVSSEAEVVKEFTRMMQIKDTTAILLQPMLSGTELYVGGKRDEQFGAMVLCGLGGIFIEVLKDVQSSLAPIYRREALEMVDRLRGAKLLDGVRGQEAIGRDRLADVVCRVSALMEHAPEIFEMDINPLLGNSRGIVAVDARIRLERD